MSDFWSVESHGAVYVSNWGSAGLCVAECELVSVSW